MCDIDFDGNTVQAFQEYPRKARKAHSCICCGTTIQPGEAYSYQSQIFEGRATDQKCCFWCWFAKAQFSEAHSIYFEPSQLRELLQDCTGDRDDDGDDWRAVLASIKARLRVSPVGRRWLREHWRRVGHAFPNTQARTTPPEEWELGR